MADDGDALERLLQVLGPVINQMVTVSVRQALEDMQRVQVVPGVVVNIDGSTAFVQMDDGGLEGSDTPGIVPTIRMDPTVTANARVLVYLFPGGRAHAHPATGA